MVHANFLFKFVSLCVGFFSYSTSTAKCLMYWLRFILLRKIVQSNHFTLFFDKDFSQFAKKKLENGWYIFLKAWHFGNVNSKSRSKLPLQVEIFGIYPISTYLSLLPQIKLRRAKYLTGDKARYSKDISITSATCLYTNKIHAVPGTFSIFMFIFN